MWIATGDIETLSQSRNSVILEAAFIAVNISSYTDKIPFEVLKARCQELNGRDLANPHGQVYADTYRILAVNFSVSEQIALGRDVTLDTLRFHCRDENARAYFTRNMARCSRGPIVQPYLREIQVFLSEVDELWFNGLSFDPPNLSSLAEQVGLPDPLWHFRKESDIRTIYKHLEIPEEVTKAIRDIPSHTALNDCLRNLMNIQAMHDAQTSSTGLKLKPFPDSVNSVANSTQP